MIASLNTFAPPTSKAFRMMEAAGATANVQSMTQEERIERAEAYLDALISYNSCLDANPERLVELLNEGASVNGIKDNLKYQFLLQALMKSKDYDVVFNSCYLTLAMTITARKAKKSTREISSIKSLTFLISLLSFESLTYPELKDSVEISKVITADFEKFANETIALELKMIKLGINITKESSELINLKNEMLTESDSIDINYPMCQFLLLIKKYKNLQTALNLKFQQVYPNQKLDEILRAKMYRDYDMPKKSGDETLTNLRKKTLEEIDEYKTKIQQQLSNFQKTKLEIESATYNLTEQAGPASKNKEALERLKKAQEQLQENLIMTQKAMDKIKAILSACDIVKNEKLTERDELILAAAAYSAKIAAAVPATATATHSTTAKNLVADQEKSYQLANEMSKLQELAVAAAGPMGVQKMQTESESASDEELCCDPRKCAVGKVSKAERAVPEAEIQELLAAYKRKLMAESKRKTAPAATAVATEVPKKYPSEEVELKSRTPKLIEMLKDMKQNGASYNNKSIMTAIRSFGTVDENEGSKRMISVHHAITKKLIIGFIHERHGSGREDFSAATFETKLLIDLVRRAGYWSDQTTD